MKTMKLLSMASAIVLLASCSAEDDFQQVAEYQLANDGTEVFVTVEEPELATRAGFANAYNTETGKIKQQFLWADGDHFKMYKSNTWKPQDFKFTGYATINGVNGSIFTWQDTESGYNDGTDAADMTNREYAVYPAEYVQFKDEYRKNLYMTIPSTEIDYGTPVKLTASDTYKNEKTGETENKDGYIYVAKEFIPLFGFAADNKVSFNYLTALLRVNVQEVAAGDHTLTLTSNANKLNGEFVSTEFNAVEGTSAKMPVFKTQAKGSDDNTITVKFTATADLGTEYVIYIPVPVGTYAANDLALRFDSENVVMTNQKDGKELASDEVELTAGNYLLATRTKPAEVEITSLSELQTKVLNELNAIKRKTEYNVTVASSATNGIVVDDLGHKESYYTLTVPSDQAAEAVIKLVAANESNNGLFAKGEASSPAQAYTLKIKGGKAGQKLTIETANENVVGLDLSEFVGDITVKGDWGTNGDVTTTKTGAFDFTGKVTGKISTPDEATANITLNTNDVTKETTIATTGNVALEGKYSDAVIVNAANVNLKGFQDSGAITVTATQDITVAGVGVRDHTAGETELNAANININAESWFKKLTTTSTTKTTVEEKVLVKGEWYSHGELDMKGNHNGNNCRVYDATTIAEGANISKLVLEGATASVTVKGTSGELTTKGGTVTIDGGKVTTRLVLNQNVATPEGKTAGIVLKNGTIESFIAADKTAAVYSEGKSDIKAATDDDNVTYEAAWDEDTEAVDIPSTGNIYTAAQLAKLQEVTTAADYTLKANVTVTDGVEVNWTPAMLYENVSSGVTFDGNGKTITGLTVKKNTSNVGFFSKFAGSAKVTVKDLTLDKLNISATNEKSDLVNVGGLVGYAATATDITGVAVIGTSIGSAESGRLIRVGGLIGSTNSTVTIENTKVDWQNIYGWYMIGGLIGNIGNNSGAGNVTVKVSDKDFSSPVVTVNNIALSRNAPATSSNNGLIGMLVGVLSTKNTQFTAKTGDGITASNVYKANILNGAKKAALGFNNNIQKFSSVNFYYVGQDGNYIGYSKNYGNEKAEIIGTKYAAPTPADGTGLNKYDITENK